MSSAKCCAQSSEEIRDTTWEGPPTSVRVRGCVGGSIVVMLRPMLDRDQKSCLERYHTAHAPLLGWVENKRSEGSEASLQDDDVHIVLLRSQRRGTIISAQSLVHVRISWRPRYLVGQLSSEIFSSRGSPNSALNSAKHVRMMLTFFH